MATLSPVGEPLAEEQALVSLVPFPSSEVQSNEAPSVYSSCSPSRERECRNMQSFRRPSKNKSFFKTAWPIALYFVGSLLVASICAKLQKNDLGLGLIRRHLAGVRGSEDDELPMDITELEALCAINWVAIQPTSSVPRASPYIVEKALEELEKGEAGATAESSMATAVTTQRDDATATVPLISGGRLLSSEPGASSPSSAAPWFLRPPETPVEPEVEDLECEAIMASVNSAVTSQTQSRDDQQSAGMKGSAAGEGSGEQFKQSDKLHRKEFSERLLPEDGESPSTSSGMTSTVVPEVHSSFPQANHPFVRIPAVKPGSKYSFVRLHKIYGRSKKPLVQLLRPIRLLLLKPVLDTLDLQLLRDEAENLVGFVQKMRNEVRHLAPSRALKVLAPRFMALNALHSIWKVMGPYMKRDMWWKEVVHRVPSEYRSDRFLKPETRRIAALVLELCEALEMYKLGKAPTDGQVIHLKTMIFASDLSASARLRSGWNQWVEDAKVDTVVTR